MTGQLKSIAIIANSALSINNFRGTLIRELAAQGTKVFALAPDYDAESRRQVIGLGAVPVDIGLDRAGLSPLRALRDLMGLTFTLRRLKPESVLCYFLKPVVLGTWAAVFAGIKRRYVLIEGLGFIFGTEGKRQLALVRGIFASALARASAIMVLNGDDRDLLITLKLAPPANTIMIGGIGVDLSYFVPAPPVFDPVTFIHVARLIREKGLEDYVAAARLVRARYPAARFVILGGADPSPIALPVATVEKWVDEGLMIWHGDVVDVRPHLACASVFVLPSFYREGVPRSTQEAMAMARPVLTTDNVGCRETVIEGLNGYLVPTRDPDALAVAMMRFVDDRSLIASMGAASRDFAEQRFDCRSADARILTILNHV